jgi:hypothetical protein
MARGKAGQDEATLKMALVGYELEKEKIEAKIREIEKQLGQRRGKPSASAVTAAESPRKRVLSAAARKRIAMAQKKRWAEHRKKAAAAKKGQG